jgi:hypothetical protein
MEKNETSQFIIAIDNLADPLLEIVKAWVDSDAEAEGDLRIPLFALSKVTAVHMQAMVIGLEMDEKGKEMLMRVFTGALTAALDDLDGFVKSEEIINKMMGKPCD